MLKSYLDLNFDLLHAATYNRFVDGNDKTLVNLGAIVLFSNYKLTTSSEKHLGDNSHAHIVSSMYELKTSARDIDELSTCFDRDRNRRRNEFTNNKSTKDKFHLRYTLQDIFGFAKHQEKATNGLGYNLTLTRNQENAVLNKDNAINNAKIKIIANEWYVPYYTPGILIQAILSKQTLSKVPTDLQYVESVFMKEVNTQNFWTFEIGTQEELKISIRIIVGFQERDRQDSQNLNNDTFYRPPVTSAQCIIGTENYSDNSTFLNFDDDDYSQGCGPNKEAFRALTKFDILNSYIYLIMILDPLTMIKILVIIYTFSIKDIRKLQKVLNQLK